MVSPLTPLEWARTQLGVREATGHNDGVPAERYLDGEAGLAWCFGGETEILTERGWVRFDELPVGLRVAQVHPETLRVELVRPLATIRKFGPALRIKRRGLDLTVDPEHRFFGRWVLTSRKGSRASLPEREMRAVSDLLGDARSVSIPPAEGTHDRDLAVSDRDLRLLAVYIADGFIHQNRLQVSVSRADKIAFLKTLRPQRVYQDSKVRGPRSKKPLTHVFFPRPEILGACTDEKALKPAFLWALSRRQARLLLNTIRMLDGSCRHSPEHGQHVITQASKERIDSLHMLAVLAGYPATTGDVGLHGEFGSHMFRLGYGWHRRPTRLVPKFLSPAEPQALYCVSVPTELIVIRPPFGTALISGNCAAFVLWCFRKGSCALPGNRWKLRSVQEMYRAMRDEGTFVSDPAPGDIVFFNSRLGSDPGHGQWHVGIVETVSATDVATIEGNVGDAVRRCSHSRTNPRIVGYARWPKAR